MYLNLDTLTALFAGFAFLAVVLPCRALRSMSVAMSGFDLAEVSVRPVADRAESARWDVLMSRHHYLGFRGLVGGGVRQVAELPDGTWLALLGWHAGSFKVGVRDRLIGWTREQQFRRLRLVANNTRFLVLPGARVPNLASRVLGLSLRRLSQDMKAQTGHPVLLAETFVDPARFSRTCYRAANWREIGRTRGYARVPGGGWREHGEPKRVLIRELRSSACTALRQPEDDQEWGLVAAPPRLPEVERLRSLYEFLRQVSEYRKARGIRHSLATVFSFALAAKLAGVRGVVTIGEFAARLTQAQLAAVRAFWSPSRKRHVAPSRTSFHRVLSQVAPEVLDEALSRFIEQNRSPHGAVAVDGKVTAAEWIQGKDSERLLLQRLDIRDRVVTLDALHTQRKTAQLIAERGGFYLMTVKGNQQELLDGLASGLDWEAAQAAATEHETVEKGHGRIETRRCRVIPLDLVSPDCVAMPHRRQAIRIERERHVLRTRRTSTETVYGVTSLGPEQASASELLRLNRGHWEIENRLHYVRDVSYDEDRNRIRAKRLRRNLACLANAAISIVRLDERSPGPPPLCRPTGRRHATSHPTQLPPLKPRHPTPPLCPNCVTRRRGPPKAWNRRPGKRRPAEIPGYPTRQRTTHGPCRCISAHEHRLATTLE